MNSDDAVLKRVADRLAERGIASFTRIGLDIKGGVVTVHGTVASKGERLLLIHLLRTTQGIRVVNDGLTIGRSNAFTRSQSSSSSWSDLFSSLPPFPTLDSLKETFSSMNPAHVAIALIVLFVGGYFVWPRGASRPVAVYPVKGKIVMEGAPMAQATVVLHPTGPTKLPEGILPRATADADGNVVFQTFDPADGSPEGEFIATVHLMKPILIDGDMVPGPDLAPAIYRTSDVSPLRVTITREIKEISLLEVRSSARPTGRGSE